MCWPEVIGAALLVAIAVWVTWIVAEQVGYSRGIADWKQHDDAE